MKVVASVQYERIRQIGVGQGMNSTVFQIRDPQLGSDLVVKEIDKTYFRQPISDYFSEAQAMFATSHINVAPIRYACETSDMVCLVMPYFRAGCLSDMISNGPIPLKEVVRVGLGALAGASRIHSHGYAHFDIKPSNILFSDAGEPMIADFGQARRLSAFGTSRFPPVYRWGVPPEFYSVRVGTAQSDIYHLGLLLYRAANGDPFFRQQICEDDDDRKRMTLAGKYPNRKLFMPHVPRRLRAIIRKALNVEPEKRYQSAPEMARDIGRVAIGLDWITTMDPNGSIAWRARRDGQPDIVVELTNDPADAYTVAVYTDRDGVRRRRNTSSDYRTGLSLSEAYRHLDEVFRHLG